MKKLVAHGFFAFGIGIYAHFADANGETYKGGQKLFQEHHHRLEAAGEVNGQFLLVPIDYHQIGRGKTPLYYHFSRPYDSNLPTVLEFNGGPGASSHDPKVFEGFNVLNFDARGIAFSRPESYEVYSDRNIYSSENVMRDAAEILKRLKIEKVTVLGASYGSVPATLFAERFPHKTSALVLINPTSHQVSTAVGLELLRDFTQKLLDSLDSETLEFLKSIANEGDTYTHDELVVYAKIALDLWHESAFLRLKDLITRAAVSRYEMAFHAVMQSELGLWFQEMAKLENPLYFDPFVREVIESKEAPADRNHYAVKVRNGLAVIEAKPNSHFNVNAPLATFGARTLAVPVFIMAGSEDVLTPVNKTKIEFQSLKAPRKQMLLFSGRGHNLMNLKRWSQSVQTEHEKAVVSLMTRKLFRGVRATQLDLETLSKKGDIRILEIPELQSIGSECDDIVSFMPAI